LQRKKHHLLTTAGFILACTLVAALVTVVIGRSLLIANTTARLHAYATDFLVQDDLIARNVNETLAVADASPSPPCSDEDLLLLRTLLFRSPYVKDVGRKQDGHLVCAAIVGKINKIFDSPPPNRIQADGHAVRYNVHLAVDPNFSGEVITSDRSNVVLGPDIFHELRRPPFFFSAAVVDRTQHAMVTTYSNSPIPPTVDLMLSGTTTRTSDYLLYAQCSTVRPDCVLTGIRFSDILRPNRALIVTILLVGALTGFAFSATALYFDRRHGTLPSQLRRAIHQNRLDVVYQPVVDVRTTIIVSAEALVRWTDDDGDPVPPELFIALAETHGFVGAITNFVLGRVIDDFGDRLRTDPTFHISINMSSQDLSDVTFIPRLDNLLRIERIPASSIGLELTERSTADREHVIEMIQKLRSRGHVVYIDDFGTGYSSLSYLNELSVDVIKVDRAFTQTLGTHSVTASILPQILAMARALKLKIVIEGVERPEQAAYLANIDGDLRAQGWLFGKPVPPQVLEASLTQPLLQNV
jgi:sensor c-di-GMP phosphodiesterase-like protein